jgi:hypothetical protein
MASQPLLSRRPTVVWLSKALKRCPVNREAVENWCISARALAHHGKPRTVRTALPLSALLRAACTADFPWHVGAKRMLTSMRSSSSKARFAVAKSFRRWGTEEIRDVGH